MSEKDLQKLSQGFATKAIHCGYEPSEQGWMALGPPIVTSASFKEKAPGEFYKYEYGRVGNPTRDFLEQNLAGLENGKYCIAFGSGLGAITAICQLLEAGDHVICGDDLYGGAFRIMSEMTTRNGIEVTFVDLSDLDAYEKQFKKNTKLIWFETPTNPTLKVIDIVRVTRAAHLFNKNIIVGLDNTFLTPYFQQPLELGVDIVMHSITKYLNGHGDVIMGAAVVKRDDLHDKLRHIQYASGIIPSPFDCYQAIRGMATLKLRMDEHSKSALQIATFLENHPLVTKVRHPGLPSHRDYELTKRQTTGHSGMIGFYIKGGIKESTKFFAALKLITMAGSLGTVKSLIELPIKTSHASMPADHRERLGITDSYIRVSVGLEDVKDLIADLDMALKASQE